MNKCESCMYYVAAENVEVMPGPFTGFCICPKKGKNAVDFAYRKANCYHFRERNN